MKQHKRPRFDSFTRTGAKGTRNTKQAQEIPTVSNQKNGKVAGWQDRKLLGDDQPLGAKHQRRSPSPTPISKGQRENPDIPSAPRPSQTVRYHRGCADPLDRNKTSSLHSTSGENAEGPEFNTHAMMTRCPHP